MKIEIHQLTTGHWAPAADVDIWEKNRITGKFPHCSVLAQIPEAAERIAQGKTVLDVGAFIGDNTLEFVKQGWRVHAFEPFLDAHICARLNCPAAIHHHAAVGNREKVELVYDCPGTNHGMRSVRRSDSGTPTLAIDDLDLYSCAFIKIDVEGWECSVLRGACETIRRFRPLLHVEAFPGALAKNSETAGSLKELMESFGYLVRMEGAEPRWDWIGIPL